MSLCAVKTTAGIVAILVMCQFLNVIEWISGEDIGKRTILDASWIRGFQEENYENFDDESFVIEWRDKKKPPWKLYDGIIIEINKKHSTLEKQMLDLESKKTECLNEPSGGIENETGKEVEKFKKLDQQKEYNKDDQLNILRNARNKTVEKLEEENANFKRKYHEAKNENKRLKRNIIDELPVIMTSINNLIKELEASQPSACSTPSRVLKDNSFNMLETIPPSIKNNSLKIELFSGTQIMVDKLAMAAANKSKTAGSFVGVLLQNLFSIDVLVSSNLRGGSSKLNPSGERKKQLDAEKMDALYKATMLKFPDTSKSAFGVAIHHIHRYSP